MAASEHSAPGSTGSRQTPPQASQRKTGIYNTLEVFGTTPLMDWWWCTLNSTGWYSTATCGKLWGMAKAIKVGQIVVPDGLVGVYRVVGVSPDGLTADIEKFDVSKQKSLGDPIRAVAMNKLTAYKEDASQTAARIVREATTED